MAEEEKKYLVAARTDRSDKTLFEALAKDGDIIWKFHQGQIDQTLMTKEDAEELMNSLRSCTIGDLKIFKLLDLEKKETIKIQE